MNDPTLHISALLDALRTAAADGPEAVSRALRADRDRLTRETAYRESMREEIRGVLGSTTSTHLLTDGGILSSESVSYGVARRVGNWLAPAPPRAAELENAMSALLRRSDIVMIDALAYGDVLAWVEVILDCDACWDDRDQLASALVILAMRVAGAGLDARLAARMPSLEAWNSPFIALSRVVDRFAETYVATEKKALAPGTSRQGQEIGHLTIAEESYVAVESCHDLVVRFRAEKEELGTTLHLSSASLRMLQQLTRLRLLIECTCRESRAAAIAELSIDLAREACHQAPVRQFLQQKFGLLAYLAIGHAAQKGNKYAVRNRNEYAKFWRKSLLGGVIVALFALVKLDLSHSAIAPAPQALIYGANYALCFALIYVFGGTLATKQPALTASRLAESLEEGPEHESFPDLVQAIWRSQFISFLGNIVGAGAVAVLLVFVFGWATGTSLLAEGEAATLAEKLHPLHSGTLFYAAVAGVMLSLAGFVAGFIDNAVIFHRLADRVEAGGGLLRLLPSAVRSYVASRLQKHFGALSGNIVLGFLLGSAGSIGLILGLPLDIRHIAFASSHGAVSLVFSNGTVSIVQALWVVVAVASIGFINFAVSFGLTLAVAVNARRLDGVDWRRGRRQVFDRFRANKLAFLIPIRAPRENVP